MSFHVALLRSVITKIWNTEKCTLSLQVIQQVIFEQKEIANLTVIDSGKLPAESSHISTAHQKAVKMEVASVCRQWCCDLHPRVTWMSRRRGWELKPTWFWFSPWLETIHPQDTLLSLCEGWEKWKGKSGSLKYLALNISYKLAKAPELSRLSSRTWSCRHMSIKLLCLTVPSCVSASSQGVPNLTRLVWESCHPVRPSNPSLHSSCLGG